MCAEELQAVLPADARWVDLTSELVSADPEHWCSLVDAFTPTDHKQGHEMAAWLRGCVHEGHIPYRTRVVHNHELLGFFTAVTIEYMVSNRPAPVLAVSRRIGLDSPETGLLLSFIVRSEAAGKGFGRFLIEGAVVLALEMESEGEKIAGLLVEPANPKLHRVWQEHHHFATPGSSRPRLKSPYLHLPVKTREELQSD